MKRPAYTYLVVLAVVALLGSTAVQCAWIYHAYRYSQAHLRVLLNEALTQAVDELNTAEELAFIARVGSDTGSTGDAVHREFRFVHTEEIVLEDSAVVNGSETLDSLKVKLSRRMANKPGKHPLVVKMEYTGDKEGQDSEFNVEWREDSLVEHVLSMEQSGRLKEVVELIKKENLLNRRGWKNRLDSATLHQKIAKQLALYGIEGGFEFAVLNKKSEPFDGFVTRNFDPRYTGASARVLLFPDDLRTKDLFAAVQVHSVLGHVMFTLWPVILASLCFTALMVVLFLVTIKKLFSQSRLSQLKTDFINNMSHELKTPLATISLAADAIRHPAGAGDSKGVAAFADAIKKEQQRMNAHIERVLQMAQSEEGKFIVNKEPLDLGAFTRELMEDLRLVAANHHADLELDAEEGVWVQADAFHLRAALSNLVDNGMKYTTASRPVIRITGRKAEGGALIEVCDNGIGIAPGQQKLIFSRFYRVQSGDVHRVKGFGLGLSYVHTVVSAHGGEISVQSAPGQGSCFSIKLPAQ